MERIWQWAWDRYGASYSWVVCASAVVLPLPIYLALSLIIVAYENSGHYLAAAVATVVAMPLFAYPAILPGRGQWQIVQRWAAGDEVDPARALEATYAWSRGAAVRVMVAISVWATLLAVVVGVIAGLFPASRAAKVDPAQALASA